MKSSTLASAHSTRPSSMSSCKRKLDELGDDANVDASGKQPRLSTSAGRIVSEHLGLAASGLRSQDILTTTHHAGTHRSCLALLPTEVLLNIFARCRNPSLSHVSNRLHQILPPFREISRSLAGFAMAALPYTDGNGKPANLRHLPIWEVADELYASSWVEPPRSLNERLALQREVFDSCWFGRVHFETIHSLTYRKVLSVVFLRDSCIRYREADPSITAQQTFVLSKGQVSKIKRLVTGKLRVWFGLQDILNLRTENRMHQALQIDIDDNNVSFRTGKIYREVYTVTSISHIPSFIYKLPIRYGSPGMLSFIEYKARGIGLQYNPDLKKDERRLFCSRDKLRRMFNRIIDDESAWGSSGTYGLSLVNSLLSLDEACFRDQGRHGVVGYELYRKVAFRNLPICLESIFEHMSHDTDRLPNHKTLEELSDTLEPGDQEEADRIRRWDTVRCIDKHAMDLYRLHCFNKIRAEGRLSPLSRVSEIDEITGCGG